MGNSKRIALAFLLGATLVGGVLGFTTARVFGRAEISYLDRPSMSELLADDLGLTPDQRVQLDSILDRRYHDMHAAMQPLRPQLDSIRNRARDEIRRMLVPAQRATFERILAEEREHDKGGKKP